MRLLVPLLATLAYPGGVAGDVSDAVLAGAVVGTFVGTGLMCGVLAAVGCCYYSRRKRRRGNDDQRKQRRSHDPENPNTSSGNHSLTNAQTALLQFLFYLFICLTFANTDSKT